MTTKVEPRTLKNNKYRRRYPRLIKEMMHLDDIADFELAHDKQEHIYELFINDIAGKKYNTMEEVTQVARQLKLEVIEYSKDKPRWFA